MQIGRLILRRRKELHLTQDALAVGICSTSYLSKIENGQVTPHTEVLSALLKRLGLDPDLARETDKREMEFDDQLHQWYAAIKQHDLHLAWKLYQNLKQTRGIVVDSALLITYTLFEVRYFLMNKELKQAMKGLTALKKEENLFSPLQSYYYYQFLGLYHRLMEEYDLSLKAYATAEQYAKEARIEDSELYYQLANLHSRLYHISYALLYAATALEKYTDESNLFRVIDTLILMGINQQRLNMFDESYQSFARALKIADQISEEQKKATIYHNMGYLYFKQSRYAEAIEMYRRSLKLREEREKEKKANTYYYMAILYHALGDKENAESANQAGMELIREEPSAKTTFYHLTLQALRFKSEIHTQDLELVEKTILPYFQKKGIWITVAECAEFLAGKYRGLKRTGKVIRYQQVEIEALRRMRDI